MKEALSRDWFKTNITNKNDIISKLTSMNDSDDNWSQIVTLLGGSSKPSNLDKDAFDISSLSSTARKIHLKQQHRIDGNSGNQEITIPDTISTKADLKIWLSNTFNFQNDAKLTETVDALATKLVITS